MIGLSVGGDLSLDGDVDVTIPAAQCRDALWFCVNVEPGSGADYSDSDLSNNWECVDISAAKSCATGKITHICKLNFNSLNKTVLFFLSGYKTPINTVDSSRLLRYTSINEFRGQLTVSFASQIVIPSSSSGLWWSHVL